MKTLRLIPLKLASLSLACLMATWSSWGFTLYNGNLHGYNADNPIPVPPQALFDNPPDLSDCINKPLDHWAWPVNNGQVVITYWYDSSFDALFKGPNGPATEAAIKAQIVLAMQQWSLASYGQYGWFYYGTYDSYARANPLILDVQQTQNIAPFMDVRSATVHELGHILGFTHPDAGVNAQPNPLNFAYFYDGDRGYGSLHGTLGTFTDNFVDGGVPWLNYYVELLNGTPPLGFHGVLCGRDVWTRSHVAI